MINTAIYDFMRQVVPEKDILINEPLSRHTTFRVGGEADFLVRIESREQLFKLVPFFQLVEQDFFIVGNGSNVLAGDRGYRGIILQISDQMSQVTVEGNKMIVQAGASLSGVAKCAYEKGLTGLEFAAGIPGTIGGGVVMNAGAYGGEMKQVVQSVLVMNKDGELMEINNETMEFGYRTSAIKSRKYIVLEAELALTADDPDEIRERMNLLAAQRREKQPLEYASAGSTFKRPAGHFAGKLIMDAGLRGYRVGDACVSDKHCGFIVNTGHATAEDIAELIQEVQARVYECFNVRLEPEVIYLGDF